MYQALVLMSVFGPILVSGKYTCSDQYWLLFGTRCYKIGDTLDYSAATKACSDLGGYVIMPKTPEEMEFANSLQNINGTIAAVWIGLKEDNSNGIWKWADGSLASDQDMVFDSDPNNGEDCTRLNINGIVRDMICSSSYVTICQRDADLEATPNIDITSSLEITSTHSKTSKDPTTTEADLIGTTSAHVSTNTQSSVVSSTSYIKQLVSTTGSTTKEPVPTILSTTKEPVSTTVSTTEVTVSTTVSSTKEPVSTTVSTTEVPVSTTVSTTKEPVSTTVSTTREPVSTTVSTTREPVPTIVSTTKEPVSTTVSSTKEPVSTTVSTTREPVSTTVSTTKVPVSTTVSTTKEPVSTTVSTTEVPVSTTVSTTKEPVSTTVSTTKEPVSTTVSTSKEPVSTTVSTTKELVSTIESETKAVPENLSTALKVSSQVSPVSNKTTEHLQMPTQTTKYADAATAQQTQTQTNRLSPTTISSPIRKSKCAQSSTNSCRCQKRTVANTTENQKLQNLKVTDYI